MEQEAQGEAPDCEPQPDARPSPGGKCQAKVHKVDEVMHAAKLEASA